MSDQQIQLMQGDCLDLMPLIPAGSVDMILTDLPYGTTACAWDTVIPFAPLWEAYRRVIVASAAIVLTAAAPFDKHLAASNLLEYKYDWIWQKTRFANQVLAHKQPLRIHEHVLIFYRNTPTYNPQGLVKFGRTVKQGQRKGAMLGGSVRAATIEQEFTNYPRTILTFDSPGNPKHPTQKPVPLLEYLIRTYTNKGETVLDSCMGSASTAIACMRTGRKFIGIEKDAHYFEVACQRVKDEQRQGRLFTL